MVVKSMKIRRMEVMNCQCNSFSATSRKCIDYTSGRKGRRNNVRSNNSEHNWKEAEIEHMFKTSSISCDHNLLEEVGTILGEKRYWYGVESQVKEVVTKSTERSLMETTNRRCEGILKIIRAGKYKIQLLVTSHKTSSELTEMEGVFNELGRNEIAIGKSKRGGRSGRSHSGD